MEKKILENYAKVIINFALNKGKGIKKGETVLLVIPEQAKKFLPYLHKIIYQSGGNCITYYLPKEANRHGVYNLSTNEFFEYANQEQLKYFPQNMRKGIIKDIDHRVRIESPTKLKKVNGEKLMTVKKVMNKIRKQINKKEEQGKLSWNISLFPTNYLFKLTGMTKEEYRNEIIKACFLDSQDPIKNRQEITQYKQKVVKRLNELKIKKMYIKGENVDLQIGLVPNSKWITSNGENIPSFEIFTSPNRKETQGRYKANHPISVDGQIIKGVYLKFENGKVTKGFSEQGNDLFQTFLKIPHADKLGEFSLTDKKTSKINKFMGTILYDENTGGKFGNMHIAIGTSFTYEIYSGPEKPKTDKQRRDLGFNVSAVHLDIISTDDRTVKAQLKDGSEKIIYKNGSFCID